MMKVEEMRKQLRILVKQNKDDHDAWISYASFELQQGELQMAERLCKKALVLTEKNSVDALYVLGVVYIEKDDRGRALKVLRRAERLAPHRPELSLVIGSVLIELRLGKEAEKHAKKVLEKHPNEPNLLNYLALGLELCGKKEEAEQAIRRSLFMDESIPNNWFTLGMLMEGQGRFEEAEKAYKRAVYLDTHDPQPRKCLEHLYKKMGRYDDAELVWQPDLGDFYKNLPHDERVRFDEYMKIGDDALRDFLITHYGIVEGDGSVHE